MSYKFEERCMNSNVVNVFNLPESEHVVKAEIRVSDCTDLRLSDFKVMRDTVSDETTLTAKDNTHFQERYESHSSIVDELLSEIYDHWHDHRHDSFDSDTFTECSSTSEFAHWRHHSIQLEIAGRQIGHLHRSVLQEYGIKELWNLFSALSRYVNHMSARLVRQLKRRERRMSKLQNNCDIVTAIIQASSPKRRIDTRMKFSVEPTSGDSAFDQWKDAMKAVARLPLGIPAEFRKKVWLALAEHHIKDLKINWELTVKFAFNEKSNPDDNKLGLQIVKDLHRTGCSGFSGKDNEEERALLKRILLAYARWNKAVGYCQGFNVIAALLLEVMDRKEADALKVMIYLIDHVLPQGYFSNNLRALSVDMAVFRDLLKIFPKLSRHLDYLQHAQDQTSGGCFEPPLTNVFTMQWFLTLFATCLPKATVLRVWDSILLDTSEIILRTALVIWGKLSSRILTVSSADEFYTLMGDLTQDMMDGNILDADTMIKCIYNIAPFPFPQLMDLREKYTYNIRPFTSTNKKTSWIDGAMLPSDEDELDDEDIESITCFTGIMSASTSGTFRNKNLEDQRTGSLPDISSLGPGAYGLAPTDSSMVPHIPAYMERMTTDISALKKQYTKLRQRQNQAHVIITSATAKHNALKIKPMTPTIETPTAMNHLFLHKRSTKGKNQFVAAGPRIANIYPSLEPIAQKKQRKLIKTVLEQPVGESQLKWIQKHKEKELSGENIEVVCNNNEAAGIIEDASKNNNSEKVIQDANRNRNSEILIKNANRNNNAETVAKDEDRNDIKDANRNNNAEAEVINEIRKISEATIIKDETENRENFIHVIDRSIAIETCTSNSIMKETEYVHETNTLDFEKHLDKKNSELEDIDSVLTIQNSEKEDSVFQHHSPVSNSDSGLLGIAIASPTLFGSFTETSHQHSRQNNDVNDGTALDSAASEKDTANDKMVAHIGCDVHCNTLNIKICSKFDETVEVDNSKLVGTINMDSGSHLCNAVSCGDDCYDEIGNANRFECNETELEKSCTVTKHVNFAETLGFTSESGALLINNNKMNVSNIKCNDNVDNSYYVCNSNLRNIPDVFSPVFKSTKTSFQQYCIKKKNMCQDSRKLSLESQLDKSQLPKKVFNPFPMTHINQNRAKTGIKLGLYKQSTLEEFEKHLKAQSLCGK